MLSSLKLSEYTSLSFEPLPSAPPLGPLKLNRCTGHLLDHLRSSFTCVFLFLYVLSLLSHRDEGVHVPASAKSVNKNNIFSTLACSRGNVRGKLVKIQASVLNIIVSQNNEVHLSEFPKKATPHYSTKNRSWYVQVSF